MKAKFNLKVIIEHLENEIKKESNERHASIKFLNKQKEWHIKTKILFLR